MTTNKDLLKQYLIFSNNVKTIRKEKKLTQEELAEYLDEVARNIAREAIAVARVAKRKTVKAEDIKFAIKNK